MILITGAAGFIGYHVAGHLLAQGKQVLGVDNLNGYYDPALKRARLDRLLQQDGFRFLKMDVSDPEVVLPLAGTQGIDAIIHLAAQAGVRYSLENPFAYVQSNVMGQVAMLELARRIDGLKNFVYASSSSVYGGNTKVPFDVVDDVEKPQSLYAATKRSDELIGYTCAHLYGLPCTGLRFFTVYGPWGRPDMAYYKFTKAILAGTPIETYASGALQRDFTYIDDIVAGVVSALDRPPPADAEEPHRLYNLGNDRPESVNALVTAIEAACGRQAQRIDKPMPLGDVPKTWADLSASRQDLGYAPSVNLEEGIRRFVAWYRDYAKI